MQPTRSPSCATTLAPSWTPTSSASSAPSWLAGDRAPQARPRPPTSPPNASEREVVRATIGCSNCLTRAAFRGRTLLVALAASFAAGGGGAASSAQAATPYTAYVANWAANSVTPINTATNSLGSAIAVGTSPAGVAITPDGNTAYVVNSGANTVTPITVATNAAGTPITVGSAPIGIAISTDGASAYVANSGFNTVTPITLATNTTRAPVTVGNGPRGIAITPDGARAYVANLGDVDFTGNTTSGSATVSGISSTARLTQGMAVTGEGIPKGTTIAAPPGPSSITLSQAATKTTSGVALSAWEPSTVTPVALATQTAGTAISVSAGFGAEPAITPDQAPVASFTLTAGAAGSATSFDASASTVAYGTITSYAWNFGDGSSATTSTPTTTHSYAAPGTYAATLTETDSAGPSTTQVFTGQTMSRNGGLSAQAIRAVTVASALPSTPSPPPKALPASGSPPATPVLISAKSVSITARGDVLVHLTCPATARGGCHGTITIRLAEPHIRRTRALAARCGRGCRSLGSAKYEARAGQKVRVRVHIASVGRRLLAQRKSLRVTVTATSVSGGHTATIVRKITLRARTRAA